MPSHYVTADANILEQYKLTDLALKVVSLTSDRGSNYANEEVHRKQYFANANLTPCYGECGLVTDSKLQWPSLL